MEEDVRIPISLEVKPSSLIQLKEEVKKAFEEIQSYQSKRGSKKDPYIIPGVDKLKDDLTEVERKLDEAQKKFETLSANTDPFKKLHDEQAAVRDTEKSIAEYSKEINSEWSKSANFAKDAKKAEQALADLKTRQSTEQRKYNDAVKAVNRDDNGAEKRLRSLKKEHELAQASMKDEEFKLNTQKELSAGFARQAKERQLEATANKAAAEATLKEQKEQLALTEQEVKQEGYVEKFEQRRIKQLQEINAEIKKYNDELAKGLSSAKGALAKDIKDTGYKSARDKAISAEEKRREQISIAADKAIEAERVASIRSVEKEERRFHQIEQNLAKQTKAMMKEITNEIKAQEQARKKSERAAKSRSKAEIAQLNREISAIKQSASQYYYKLRALKMFGFTLNQISNTVDKFNKKLITGTTKALSAYARLIPGVNALRKAFDKTHASQKKFNREMRDTGKSTKLANTSLGKFVVNLIKAAIGVRSVYMLFRKMRKAIGEGLNSMAVQLDDVNARLSSIVTNFNYMKASITSIVQPLLNALAPALDTIADAFEKASFYAASFFAVLTGQSYVYKAIKVQTDYAESLDKTANSAKNAAKELGKYDKLNVISKDNDDNTGGMQWEKVPIDDTIKDWAEKFKNFFKDLFNPLITAWDKFKNFFIKAWKYALNEVLELGKAVAKDFWAVWESDTVQRIFDNIMQTLSLIGIIVGNIANNLREAWEHNKNGLKILISIAKSIEIISEDIRQAAEYTAKWSSELSFIPLFDELAETFQGKLIPAVERVSELFKILYEQIALKIVKDFIEGGLPQLVDMLGKVLEIIGLISENLRIGLQSGSNGILIIDRVEQLLQIVADEIQRCLDVTKEWAKNLDFRPLLSQIKTFLEDIQPLIKFIADLFGSFYTDVLLPFYKYLIEGGENKEGGFVGTLSMLGDVVNKADWEAITANMHALFDALEPFFELAWETISIIVKDLVEKILEFAASDELKTIIDRFKYWTENADPEDLANKIEKFAITLVGVTAVLHLFAHAIVPGITNWMTFVNMFKQNTMMTQVAKLTTKINGLKTGLTTVTGTPMNNFIFALKDLASVMPTPIELLQTLSTNLGNLAAPTGALVVITGLISTLSGGFKMMNEGFSLAGEGAVVFGGVLTTVGLIIAGVAAWPAVIAGAIAVFIANLGAFGDDLLNWVLFTAEDIRKDIEEFFSNLGENLGKWIGETIRKAIDFFSDFPTKLKEWIGKVDWSEFGQNILKGILAIFLLPGKLVEWIVSAIKGFFNGFVKGLKEGFDMHSPSKKMEPYGENILKGLLEGITSGLKNIVQWVSSNLFTPVVNAVKSCFGIIGNGASTVFSKIGELLPSGLKEGISKGWDNVKRGVKEIWGKVTKSANETYDVNSPSKVFDKIGIYLMEGLGNGISDESKKTLTTINNLFRNIIDTINKSANTSTFSKNGTQVVSGFSSAFSSQWRILTNTVITDIRNVVNTFNSNLNNSTLMSTGTYLVSGLSTTIKSGMNTLRSSVAYTYTREVIDAFRDNLDSNSLYSAGMQLISGLQEGLEDRLYSALNAVRSICYDIIDTAREAFDIASPSKVFAKIGEFLIKGLEVGADKESDKAELSTEFADTFIDNLYDMRSTALDIISSMIDSMQDKMEKLDFMNTFNTQMAKISSIKIPDIVVGSVLPSNIEFKQSSNRLDENTLNKVVRKAISDILNELDSNSNREPIMLQLDKRVVAEAVWDEEEKRYKQRGSYTR